MSLEQDNFEKLEAYLDGALSGAERAEVDRQLAGNPQLKKMMQELASVRDWVVALPRASAPPDLVETFQGQLERDALLGESEAEAGSDIVLRISRWPQFMSVAAIVLLAVGLALVLYKVLPDKQRDRLAINPASNTPSTSTATTQPSDPRSFGAIPDDGMSVAGRVRDNKVSDSDLAAGTGLKSEVLPAMPASKPSLAANIVDAPAVLVPTTKADAEQRTLAKSLASDRSQVSPEEMRDLQQRMARAADPNNALGAGGRRDGAGALALGNTALDNANEEAPIVLLVNAQDPRQAKQDVSDFLTRNKIVYAITPDAANRGVAPLGLPASNPTSQEAYAKKQESNNFSYRGAGGGGGGLGDAGNNSANGTQTQAAGSGDNYGRNSQSNNASNGTMDRGNQVLTQNAGGVSQGQYGGGGNGSLTNNTASLAPQNNLTANSATQPAAPGLLSLAGATASNGTNTVTLNTSQAAPTSGALHAYSTGGAYRAMLTRRQTEDLNDFIAKRGNQWAERRGDLQAPAPATLTDNAKVAAIDKAKPAEMPADEAKNVNTEAVTREKKASAEPTTRKAGEEPEKESAEARKDMRRIDLADAPPEKAPAGATKSPALPPAGADAAPPVQFKELALKAAPATNPADELHEVLIVVNDEPVLLPTILPAAGPATPAAAAEMKPASQPATAPAAAPTTAPAEKIPDTK